MKYDLPGSQGEVLPNLLGLQSLEEIELLEFEGFLRAEIIFTENLNKTTKFTVEYILGLHKSALEHLYKFAGKLRSVNLSRGGFTFPSAKFLSGSMSEFEKEVLLSLPGSYNNTDELIRDIAVTHGELLFIHPFREGNGRTARILANLMARKQGFNALEFGKIRKSVYPDYIIAVQNCGAKDYRKMIELIGSIFPS